MSKTLLSDVFNIEVYQESVDLGYIQTQTHPTLPFTIHNYSRTCTWDNKWNEATLACRGLITHSETGEVLARSFLKFFNHDQPGAPELDLSDEVVVTDKLDGSMGILYPIGNGQFAIATRGSFESDQAKWGSKIWDKKYANSFTPNPDWTYIFEIIVPQNRIVIKYGELEDLVLLGAVDIATGEDILLGDAKLGWNGPIAETFPYSTYGEVLVAEARDNAEGFVLFHKPSKSRVKIKQSEYIRLHRILTNTNVRSVWEILSTGQDYVEIFSDVPDEFHAWLKSVIDSFNAEFKDIYDKAYFEHTKIIESLPTGYGRREYAEAALKSEYKALLFPILDGKDISGIIWDMLRPIGELAAQKVFSTGGDDE